MSKYIVACAAILFLAGAAMGQSSHLDQTKAGQVVGMPGPLVTAINTAAPSADCGSSNFVVQVGSATWAGIYRVASGGNEADYIDLGPDGRSDVMSIEIWCDIEMYLVKTIANNKIYFHIGVPDGTEKVAYVQASFRGNNGFYVGLEQPHDGCDNISQLVGALDSRGQDVTQAPGYQPIPVTYTLADTVHNGTPTGWTYGTHDGTYRLPDSVGQGTGPSDLGLWWGIDDGAPGLHNFEWKVSITPPVDQVDGHYKLDPVVAARPML